MFLVSIVVFIVSAVIGYFLAPAAPFRSYVSKPPKHVFGATLPNGDRPCSCDYVRPYSGKSIDLLKERVWNTKGAPPTNELVLFRVENEKGVSRVVVGVGILGYPSDLGKVTGWALACKTGVGEQ